MMARHLLYFLEYDMAAVVYQLRSRQSSPLGVIDLLARRARTEQAQNADRGYPCRLAGRALILLGLLGGTGLGLTAFYLDLVIVHDIFGVEGFTLSLLLPPLSVLSIPWYALFHGDPAPLVLGYGAPFAGWLLIGFGRRLRGDATGDRERTVARQTDLPAAKVIAFRPRNAAISRRRTSPDRDRNPRRPVPASSHHGQTSA